MYPKIKSNYPKNNIFRNEAEKREKREKRDSVKQCVTCKEMIYVRQPTRN